MKAPHRFGHVAPSVLTIAMAVVLAACGGDTDAPSADSDSGNTAGADATAESPAQFTLPATLDSAKFCAAIDEAAVEAAMGVKIDLRRTEGMDPDASYCTYEHEAKADGESRYTGVSVKWTPEPEQSVSEMREEAENNPTPVTNECTFRDVEGVDTELGYQSSCAGTLKDGFGSRSELVVFQIDTTNLSCQLYTHPDQELATDADGAVDLCKDILTALS